MLVLFLDTETTSLSPQDGQIIELAGIVAEYDPAGLHFRVRERLVTLVKLRQTMEDKTTRLTGITEEDLALAPALIQAQEKWADWLEKFGSEIKVIAGHSPEFDLAFLKSESWYLPDGAKIMDTCALAKILVPQAAAVNLEHLIQKLGLEVKLEDAAQNQEAHRAMYDTQASLKLCEKLLQILSRQPVHREFSVYLKKHFLPLPLELFGKVELPSRSTLEMGRGLAVCNWQGEIQGWTLADKLNLLTGEELVPSLEFIQLDLEPEWMRLVVAQIYYLILVKALNPEWQLRLHGHMHKCFLFGELLADCLLRSRAEAGEAGGCVLECFEQLIPGTRYLVEETFNLGNLIMWLEIYEALEKGLDSNSKLAIQKLISSYDFLLIALQPFWVKSEYAYNSHAPQPMEQAVYLKFRETAERLRDLADLSLPAGNDLNRMAVGRIERLWPENPISSSGRMTFRFFRENLSIGRVRQNFDLQKYFLDLLERRNIQKVVTYLDQSDFEHLLHLSSLQHVWPSQMEVKYRQAENLPEVVDSVDLEEFLQEQTAQAKSAGRAVLVLAGQNSGLKDAQRILIERFEPKSYLLLGESGSLTKIGSKIIHGFVGAVVVKTGDFGYLSRIREMPKFNRVWLLCKPYVYVHPYWQSLGYDGTRVLQDLHFRSQLNYIAVHAGTPVGYVKGYNV